MSRLKEQMLMICSQSRRDKMFIESRVQRVLKLRRSAMFWSIRTEHRAPTELAAVSYIASYKHVAALRLRNETLVSCFDKRNNRIKA